MSDITVLATILHGAPAHRPQTISARTIKNDDGTATLELRPSGYAVKSVRNLPYPTYEAALDDTIAQLASMRKELMDLD